jgi:hypothetical protein
MVPAILMIKLWEACSDCKIRIRTTKYIQSTLASCEGVDDKCQNKSGFLCEGLELSDYALCFKSIHGVSSKISAAKTTREFLTSENISTVNLRRRLC